MKELKCLAFGDSVMWGQGLLEKDKFTTKVCSSISNHKGLPFYFKTYAHSGAVISATQEQREEFIDHFPHYFRNEEHVEWFRAGTEERMTVMPGEMPNSFPTITFQVESENKLKPEEVDIIFVDGGANDVNFEGFLNPLKFSYQEDRANISHAIRIKLKGLVEKVRKKYPTSLIILTGFYPIFSKKSNLDLLRRLFYWSQVYEGAYSWNELAANEVLEIKDIEALSKTSRRRVFNAFQHASYALREIVEELADPNLILGEPKFDLEQSLFAPKSCVHRGFMLEGENEVTGTWVRDEKFGSDADLVHDPVFEQRKQDAEKIYWNYNIEHDLNNLPSDPDKISRRDKELYLWGKRAFFETAQRVSFLHPNEGGAQLYTNDIMKKYYRWNSLSVKDQLVREHGRVTSIADFRSKYNTNSTSLRALALNAPVDYMQLRFDAPDDFIAGIAGSQVKMRMRINGTDYDLPILADTTHLPGGEYIFSYLSFREAGIPEFNISDIERVELQGDLITSGLSAAINQQDSIWFDSMELFVDGKRLFKTNERVDVYALTREQEEWSYLAYQG